MARSAVAEAPGRVHRAAVPGGRPWAVAIGKVVAAVEAAAEEMDVRQDQVLTALLAEYGAAADVPVPSDVDTLTAQLGPYLSGRAVCRRAGISRQALHARRTRWAILGVPTDDHSDPILYPARQFADATTATVLLGVRKVASQLASGIDDPLTIAVWFDTANPDLDGRTAYEWLRAGKGVDRVLGSAARDVRRWRQ